MRNLNSLLTICLLFAFASMYAQPEAGMPSEPGKCYARCLIADEYETVTEKVLVKEASTKVAISPATYETVSERVLTKEAGTALTASSAQFETVTEQKLAQEASTTLSITPARFETMSERVLTKEAPRAMVGTYSGGSNMGEVGTLLTSAARFENSSEQILVKEAYTVLRVVPAVFETVSEQKLVQAAYTTISTVPAEYETVTEQVLTKEAYTELSVVPAVYETVTEQVLSKEGYSTIATVPAVYETVTENVLEQEAGTRIERIPAQFETVSETIQTSAASTRWEKRKADANCLSANPEDCLVWCLVEVPAQNRTITKQVRKACAAGYTASGDDCIRTIDVPAKNGTRSYQKLVTPATSRKTDVPAVYTTRTYRKLVSPATTTTREVPATYGTRSYQKLVKPAYTVTNEIPARYETVSYQKLVTPATTTVDEVPAVYATRTFQTLAAPASASIAPCGSSSVLNVNFQTGSAVLTASSNAEINRVKAMLMEKTGVTAQLVGHTDNVGSADLNKSLSTRRAQAVYQALVDAGVPASRLSYAGMGEDQPVATNATAAGRGQNRRTEMITSGDTGGGDCNVYGNRSYQKLVSAATANTTEVPARYENTSYQKLVSDAAVSSTDIPAQYGERNYKKLANAASTSVTETPAQYNNITKRNLVTPGGFTEWKEVVCNSDVTPALYRQIQEALIAKGYSVGAAGADGTFGAASKAALVKFQRDNGLPVGQMDIETLKSLGVRR